MSSKPTPQERVAAITLQDVPAIYDNFKYADGEIFFADNVRSLPNLQRRFTVDFIAFMFCLEGTIGVRVGDHERDMRANDAVFIDINALVDVREHSDDFRCLVCVMSTDLGFSMINKTLFEAVQTLRAQPFVTFTQDEMTLMVKYYELATFKMEHPELNYGRETMRSILRGYCYDLLSNLDRHLDATAGTMLRQGDRLYRRFVMMLADNSNYARSVKSFADELCVTPKYLSSVCRQHAGKTAGEMIAMSIVNRIKQQLLYSDLSIKEIASSMNFGNLSFFGKYVKRHLGQSPNNYRRQHRYGV